MAMSVLDSSVTNIALPTIARNLSADPSTTVWVVTAYQIAIVMTLLPVASLGERFGYLRVYGGGLILFVAASIACASAASFTELAVFRFIQGLGASATMGVNGALIRYAWPKRLLGRGIGYNAMVIGCSAAAGPALAGLILAIADWRWLFLVNLPTGVAAFALVLRFGPRTVPETAEFDWAGATLSAAMTGGLFLSLSDFSHGVWNWRPVAAGMASAAVAAIAIPHLRSKARPVIPFDLLRLVSLRFAYSASIFAFAAQMDLLVYLPFLLERVRHIAPHLVGLIILPFPVGVAAISPIAGRFADRAWASKMSAAGLLLLAVMFAVVAVLSRLAASPWALTPCMLVSGIGFGLFQAPNNNVMLRRGPLNRAGAAAGMLAQCRLMGQTIGALAASVLLHAAAPSSIAAIIVGCGFALIAAAFTCRR